METQFATALSEKKGEDAVKEVSLKIKSVFPKEINFVFIFFTRHYQPLSVLRTLNFTLRPKSIAGAQVPLLIYEDRIVEKGILGCCINKEDAQFKNFLVKETSSQDIESAMRLAMRDFGGEKQFVFSVIPAQFNCSDYLRAMELALGKVFNLIGAGYIKKYAYKHFQIANDSVGEGLLNTAGRGVEINSVKMGGFLPLGKPFQITKVLSKKGVIMEIDNQPAIDIYKKYLGDKFTAFRKNRFFSFYPIGIKENGERKLISVIDYLEDGSLLCIGDPKENSQANIMILHAPLLFENLKNKLEPIIKSGEGLVFMINSLMRKKILIDAAEEEIKQIKQVLGNNFKVVGIYSDYCLFPDAEARGIGMEAGNLLLTLWK
jgi:hypothetical protein